MTDRLAYIDQATFLSMRANDNRSQLVQYVWVYTHPVDQERLRRFHRNVGFGFAGRLIEPSILPFGRHRWVAATGPAAPLDVDDARPPGELGTWLDERSQRHVDPVHGPGWHLGVLPMTDGTTAVTLVASHCLMDHGAAVSTMTDAIDDTPRDFGYGEPRARTRRAALASDLRQVARDLPELGRTVVTAAKYAYRSRKEISASRPPAALGGPDGPLVLPVVSAVVDLGDWDARASDLGGTGYSLLAGFAAVLGERMGRARPADGAVTLMIALSDRDGPDDRRGNAMQIASATVDPSSATTNLTAARAAVREALSALRDGHDDKHALLPITPFVPTRAVRRTADVIFGDLPVSCSNLGDVPPALSRVDGTEAEYMLFRPVDQGVTRAALEHAGGQLVVAAGRVAGHVSLNVVGYEVGAENTRDWLADKAVRTLSDFGLKGTII